MVLAILLVALVACLFPGGFRLLLQLFALGFCAAVGYGGWVEAQQHSAPAPTAIGAPAR